MNSRIYVPQYLGDTSRDYQLFLKLIDFILNPIKLDNDQFYNLISLYNCPDSMLRYLSSYFDYDYDDKKSFEDNRTIIKFYVEMMRNRGSYRGIELAVRCYLNMIGANSIPNIIYNSETNELTISDPNVNINRELLEELIDLVKPAGLDATYSDVAIDRKRSLSTIYDNLESKGSTLYVYPNDYQGNDRSKVIILKPGDKEGVISSESDGKSPLITPLVSIESITRNGEPMIPVSNTDGSTNNIHNDFTFVIRSANNQIDIVASVNYNTGEFNTKVSNGQNDTGVYLIKYKYLGIKSRDTYSGNTVNRVGFTRVEPSKNE